jgi:NADH-quinone oxidoreductase subunit L
MDVLYDALWVRPYKGLARLLGNEPVDLVYDGIVTVNVLAHRSLAALQNGRMRWYATAMVAGLMILLGIMAGVP